MFRLKLFAVLNVEVGAIFSGLTLVSIAAFMFNSLYHSAGNLALTGLVISSKKPPCLLNKI